MTKTKLHELNKLGQSVWLDYIQRSLITGGRLRAYVDQGLSGITSNPSLFEQAISESNEYDDQIRELARAGKTPEAICEALTVEDSRLAADILRPIYDETEGGDGYFSLEVSPHLARDVAATKEAARRLFKAVDRPNIMIKVPGTPEGLLAFQELTEEGMKINVTLLFSIAQYDLTAKAYISALEKRALNSYDLEPVTSVASFFVSRIDTAVDKLLDASKVSAAKAIRGKIGLANAKIAYQHFKEAFRGQVWEALAKQGARLQRVLFGSTGTKDPTYSDVMYVDNLIGPHTVNTMPPKTLEAFLDHGKVALTLEKDLDEAQAQLNKLTELGIDLEKVTHELLHEGVDKFVQPYDKLIQTITAKEAKLIEA